MTRQNKLGMCQILFRSGTSNLRNYTKLNSLGNTQQGTHPTMAFPRAGTEVWVSALTNLDAAKHTAHSQLTVREGVQKIKVLTFPFFSDPTSRSGGYSPESALNTEKNLWGKSSPEYLHSCITNTLTGVAFFHISKECRPIPWLKMGGIGDIKSSQNLIQTASKVIPEGNTAVLIRRRQIWR